MVRKLKFHEKKLLKKTDFINWDIDEYNQGIVGIMHKYRVTRNEFMAYSKLRREIKILGTKIESNKTKPYSILAGRQLTQKLYDMGLIDSNADFALCHSLKPLDFCRRRLSTVVTSLKMADNMTDAVNYVEHGHIRIGPDSVRDPAMLVTRKMQDFVTWADASAIKRKVQQYNEIQDDFDLAE